MTHLSLAQARRIALAAQGFNDARPKSRANVRHYRRALDRMTILQIDSVNVLCRSHFLPMLARLGPYDRDKLDDWLWRSGENLEGWAHVASVTSMDLEPSLRWKAASPKWKGYVKWEAEHPEAVAATYAEVDARGPLSVSDLEAPGGRSGPWWGHSQGKTALEVLSHTGRLSIAERTQTFTTVYDLPERVVPPSVAAIPTPDIFDAHAALIERSARSLGVGTDKDIADYFRLGVNTVRPHLQAMVEAGTLVPASVEGWNDPAYLHADAKRPRSVDANTFLTPFDPVVWFRPRAERLFNFHYRIEIYVPEPKRVHGYYVLPFLMGDQLVGRADLKADRKASRLLVQASFAEPGHASDEVAAGMARSLHEMADFLGLDAVEVKPRGDLASALRSAVG